MSSPREDAGLIPYTTPRLGHKGKFFVFLSPRASNKNAHLSAIADKCAFLLL
jgi:hypothetical protein